MGREQVLRRRRLERKLTRSAGNSAEAKQTGSFGRQTRMQQIQNMAQSGDLGTQMQGSQKGRTMADQVNSAVQVHRAAAVFKHSVHKKTSGVYAPQSPTPVDAQQVPVVNAGAHKSSHSPVSQDQDKPASEDGGRRSSSLPAVIDQRHTNMPDIDFENIDALRRCVLKKAEALANRGVIALPVVGWDGREPGEQDALDRISFIFQAYKVKYYYYELLEMSRKVLMIGGMGMIYPNLPQQFAMGLAITGIWLVLGLRLQPWAHPGLNALNFFSLAFQALALFTGLIKKISIATKDSVTANDAFMTEGLQFSMQVLIVIVPASILIVENNLDPAALAQRRLRSVLKGLASFCAWVGSGCLLARDNNDHRQGGNDTWDDGEGGAAAEMRSGGDDGGGAQQVETDVEVIHGRLCFSEADSAVTGDVDMLPDEGAVVDIDRYERVGRRAHTAEKDNDAQHPFAQITTHSHSHSLSRTHTHTLCLFM